MGDSGNVTDFIIQGIIIIELKTKPFLLKTDYYQSQRYLYETQIKLGILVNFREKYLNPKRVLLADR
ncbi:MAG: GxxExxY protein [Candidatus Doudnabacteria bacterium]|nr:GxxExxY protein [Candidatus Doudnabacteria bacterium]